MHKEHIKIICLRNTVCVLLKTSPTYTVMEIFCKGMNFALGNTLIRPPAWATPESEDSVREARRRSRPRVFPASPLVVHPLLIPENIETIEQMEEEDCLCIWLNALKGHF